MKITVNTTTKYDIIIELSGGSPTQSTGRSCIFTGSEENYICSNFCKILRFNNPESAIFCYSILNKWYAEKKFFNYEG